MLVEKEELNIKYIIGLKLRIFLNGSANGLR
jgi:hypothetical protein